MRRLITFAILICICGTVRSAFPAVVVTTAATISTVSDNSSIVNDVDANTQGAVTIATLGSYSSVTTTQFGQLGMSGDFVQTRGGDLFGYSLGELQIQFTTDATVPYLVSGSYANSAAFARSYSQLVDLTSSVELYASDQQHFGATTMILGVPGANFLDQFSGNLSGTLIAGHSYLWSVQTYTNAPFQSDGGASASGLVVLEIGAVPEHESVFVWMIVGLASGGAWWWRSKLRFLGIL